MTTTDGSELSVAEPAPATRTIGRNTTGIKWIATVLMIGLVLGVLASMLPARARLLGLFAPLEGAVIGVMAIELSQRLRLTAASKTFVWMFLIGVVSTVLTTSIWWQQFANSILDEFRAPSAEAMLIQWTSKNPSPQAMTPESARDMQQLQAQLAADPQRQLELDARTSLPGYLVFRCYGLSNAAQIRDQQIVGLSLWIAELIAAGVAAAMTYRRYSSGDEN